MNSTEPMSPSLSIIMPCYKGESFIVESIKIVEKETLLFEKNFELIVVIDGFVDDGYKKAKVLEQEYKNLKVIGYKRNKGKGYAIRYGLDYAHGEYMAFLDSDLDYHPKALVWFLEIAKKKNADLIIGDRRDKNSIYKYPLIRKMASWGFNIYVNFLFPELRVNDSQAGIKLIKSNATTKKLFTYLGNFENQGQEGIHGFIFDIYLLVFARKLGLKIIQAPCIFEMKLSTIGIGKNFFKLAYKMGKEVRKFKEFFSESRFHNY